MFPGHDRVYLTWSWIVGGHSPDGRRLILGTAGLTTRYKVSVPPELTRRLMPCALGTGAWYFWLELDAAVSIADAEWAEQEARKADGQPGLTIWTDGSRDENGAVGYAVAWR